MNSSTLTVIALVIAVGADSARIDKGFADGLRVGDRGEVYYELTVGGSARQVAVAPTTVLSVTAEEATIATDPQRDFRDGFAVAFEVEKDRVTPAAILAYARASNAQIDSATMERLMPSDPASQDLLLGWLEEQKRQRLDEARVETAREAVRSVRLEDGSYRIGLPAAEARYYNQQPRFEFRLRTLDIDLEPVSRADFQVFRPDYSFSGPGTAAVDGVPHGEAAAYCRWRGARLPTEFEWEIAIQDPRVTAPPELLEWTDSWYLAYPGNTRAEAEYGERFRVLRGGSSTARTRPDAHRRRFMDPSSASPGVGFRCVRSVAD